MRNELISKTIVLVLISVSVGLEYGVNPAMFATGLLLFFYQRDLQ